MDVFTDVLNLRRTEEGAGGDGGDIPAVEGEDSGGYWEVGGGVGE